MSDFIDDILDREGIETNDPSDSGGRTKFGISEKAHPEAWLDGDVSREEARTIYKNVYVLAEKFNTLKDFRLMHQLVDFGVTSGPDTAVRLLQQVLGITIDGILGPKTLEAIRLYPEGMIFGEKVSGSVMLNLAVRDARIMRYATIAKVSPKDLKFILGWIKRAQEFK